MPDISWDDAITIPFYAGLCILIVSLFVAEVVETKAVFGTKSKAVGKVLVTLGVLTAICFMPPFLWFVVLPMA